MSDIIEAVKENVPDESARQAIYTAIIPPFEDADCDTLDECMDDDPAFAAALKKANPGIYDADD